MSSQPTSVIDVPSSWKSWFDWHNIASTVSGIIATAASALGYANGQLIGWVFALLFLVLAFAFRLLRAADSRQEEYDALSQGHAPSKDERLKHVTSLKRRDKILHYAVICTLFLSLGCVLYASIPSISRRYYTMKPERVDFRTLRYYMPGKDQDLQELLEKAPFMEAVISALREEGQATGKKYRILLGNTQPFTHPTPSFKCTMKVTEGEYDVAGYAFRRHSEHAEGYYEPVNATYPTNGPVVFHVPACEKGDELFVIVRISLLNGDQFPSDPTKVTNLQTIMP